MNLGFIALGDGPFVFLTSSPFTCSDVRMPTRQSLVLVVDDDAAIRDALAEVLEDAGYATALAVHGLAAVEQLRAGLRPDIIVLDLMMPTMSGSEFLEMKQAEPSWREIPVVVLTASTAQRGSIGGAPILPKPFTADSLLRTLKRVRTQAP